MVLTVVGMLDFADVGAGALAVKTVSGISDGVDVESCIIDEGSVSVNSVVIGNLVLIILGSGVKVS